MVVPAAVPIATARRAGARAAAGKGRGDSGWSGGPWTVSHLPSRPGFCGPLDSEAAARIRHDEPTAQARTRVVSRALPASSLGGGLSVRRASRAKLGGKKRSSWRCHAGRRSVGR